MEFTYTTSNYTRARGDLPPLVLQNMVAEQTVTTHRPMLQSRSGLQNSTQTVAATSVEAVYQADNVLGDALFVVADNKLFKDGVLVGSLDGSGPVSIAAYQNRLFVNAGASVWQYDGTTLSSVAFPDSANVKHIAVAFSRLVCVRADTGIFYWSDVLTSTVGGLNFATAEASPDRLLHILLIGDRLVLFGAETVEFWPVSSDPDLPFQPLVGTGYDVGLKNTGLAVKLQNGFAWVSQHNEVCLNQPQNVISTIEMSREIASSINVSLWTFYQDNIEFLCLKLDNKSYVYNYRGETWSVYSSWGHPNWVASCYDAGYFGTTISGTLAEWSDGYEDFGGPLERLFSAWLPLDENNVRIFNVILQTDVGRLPFLTGPFSDPTVELRASANGGKTWLPWKQRQLGRNGNYQQQVIWLSLGQYFQPGVLVNIRVYDPVPFRVSGLHANTRNM